MGPKEHFQSNVFEASFKHFIFFRSVSENSVTTVNNYNHFWQNCKECLEEQTNENFIPGEKSYFNFFKFLSEVSFAISEKLPPRLSKLQSTYLFKVLRESIYFLKLNMASTFFGLWEEKMGSLSQRVFFRVPPTKIRASTGIFRWQKISLSKKFSFSGRFFGVSVISLSFCKVV